MLDVGGHLTQVVPHIISRVAVQINSHLFPIPVGDFLHLAPKPLIPGVTGGSSDFTKQVSLLKIASVRVSSGNIPRSVSSVFYEARALQFDTLRSFVLDVGDQVHTAARNAKCLGKSFHPVPRLRVVYPAQYHQLLFAIFAYEAMNERVSSIHSGLVEIDVRGGSFVCLSDRTPPQSRISTILGRNSQQLPSRNSWIHRPKQPGVTREA